MQAQKMQFIKFMQMKIFIMWLKPRDIIIKVKQFGTSVTDKNGKTEDITNLPLGKYIVKEEKQPIGYLLDTKEYEVNLKYKNQKEQIVTGVVTSKEEVKQMKLHIYKESVNDVSGIIPGLEGVEFTIKLKSDVEKALNAGYSYVEIWNGINEDGKYVKIDKKRALKAQEIAKTYETI